MKSLNNDWDTIEFEALTPEQVRRTMRQPSQDGFDPYNSGVRPNPFLQSKQLAEDLLKLAAEHDLTIEVWFP